MLSVHDNEIISYEVSLKNEVIIIQTQSEIRQYVNIVFSDVLAHMFENHLSGSIILDIDKRDISQFFNENRDLLEQQKYYCWPIHFKDIKELEDKLIKGQYSYYIISASYGLNGWVLAKKYETLSVL